MAINVDKAWFLVRALLLVCPDHAKDIETALGSGADCLVFDLTQTTAAADMPLARQRVLAGLHRARLQTHPPSLYVRVGSLPDEQVDADLDAIMPGRPDGILLSRSQNGADVQHLSVKLSVREADHGQSDGVTKIIAMVAATAAAIFELGSYRGASRRLSGLIYSGAEIGAAHGDAARDLADGPLAPAFALARSLTLFAAKAANVVAIDAASPSNMDDACLLRECETARREGFSAKLAVDRDQVAIINAIFAEQ